ncbi:MAG: cellulase family glycosylhydrolase [Nitrospiraceae bacterium]|nr:cellulase family glycosylhydrolase [Nitrospiraceae bacterium]
MGPLKVCASNPRYFCDPQGTPVYLTGSHVWQNLQDMAGLGAFDFNAYVNFLKSYNMTFIRLWAYEGAEYGGSMSSPNYYSPLPFSYNGSKYDLTSMNQTYFARLRSRVIAAENAGIYVDVMLFQGWSLETLAWNANPYNASNNVNGWFPGDSNGDGSGYQSHEGLSGFQEAYIRKVVDTLNDLPNVLYEASNEDTFTSANVQWQYAVINYVKQYEATKPYQHPVGMTSNGTGSSDSALLASPADWISPDASCYGTASCSPSNGTKVLVPDTDHLGSNQNGAWVWESFMSGYNPIFMDGGIQTFPASTDSRRVGARLAMEGTSYYAKKMSLGSDAPRGDLSTTGYALANPGSEYLIYQPGSGNSFGVSLAAGNYYYEWFNTSTASVDASGTLTAGGGNMSFNPPSSSDAVLYLHSQ